MFIAALITWVFNLFSTSLHRLNLVFGLTHFCGFVAFAATIRRGLPQGHSSGLSIVNTSRWSNVFACLIAQATLVQPFLGCGLLVHISEEVKDGSLLVPWSMMISYLFDVIMGVMLLILAIDTIGPLYIYDDKRLYFHLMQSSNPRLTCFLGVLLVLLFVIRGIMLVTVTSRQILAFARCLDLKMTDWLRGDDDAYKPLSAITLTAVVGGLTGFFSLLKSYVSAYRNLRQFGALCIVSTFTLSIGSTLYQRYHKRRDTFSWRMEGYLADGFAFVYCISVTIALCIPPRRPITLSNFAWGASLWGVAIFLITMWYWSSALKIFNVPTFAESASVAATTNPTTNIELEQIGATLVPQQSNIYSPLSLEPLNPPTRVVSTNDPSRSRSINPNRNPQPPSTQIQDFEQCEEAHRQRAWEPMEQHRRNRLRENQTQLATRTIDF